jgi:uncharacterized membrane protein YbhN (UPF0104 family)
MIKLVFGLALLLFIGWKVLGSYNQDKFSSLHSSDDGWTYITIAFLLMPFNWIIESVKWQLLLRTFHPQTFIKTLLDVFAGIATSLITPNRIGNFIGRSLRLDQVVRTKAILTTIHSNLAQFVASVCFGLIGLFVLGFDPPYVDEFAIQFSAILILIVALFLFFYPTVIDFNPLSRLYSTQVQMAIRHIQEESLQLKIILLLLSVMRYLVFLIQFYFLLVAFDVSGDIEIIVPAIALVYLVTTIVPSFLFGKLFVREAAALFILGSFGVETPIILAAVFILWMVNLAFPALLGAYVLINKKY